MKLPPCTARAWFCSTELEVLLNWGSDRKHLWWSWAPLLIHLHLLQFRPNPHRDNRQETGGRVQGHIFPCSVSLRALFPDLMSLMLWSAEAPLRQPGATVRKTDPKCPGGSIRGQQPFPWAARTGRSSPLTGLLPPGGRAMTLKARFASRCQWSRQRKEGTRALGS